MTTFVLGAGASAHAGYPLARDLGPKLLDWLGSKDLPNLRDQRAGLRLVFELYGSLSETESILGDLDEPGPNSPVATKTPSERGLLRRSFAVAIRECFHDLLRSHSARYYTRFASERVRSGDTVVTFNYDVACERELKLAGLWEINGGYGDRFDIGGAAIPRSRTKVLKLHGSANWLNMIFGGVRHGIQWGQDGALGERPVIWGDRDFDSLGYTGLYDPNCAGAFKPAAEPCVIMGLNKRFYSETSFGREHVSFWSSLWSQAEHSLRTSGEIVIIGYSMPGADADARRLLLDPANRNARLVICCGRSSTPIRNEFASYGFHNVEIPGNGLFEDYLAWMDSR